MSVRGATDCKKFAYLFFAEKEESFRAAAASVENSEIVTLMSKSRSSIPTIKFNAGFTVAVFVADAQPYTIFPDNIEGGSFEVCYTFILSLASLKFIQLLVIVFYSAAIIRYPAYKT